MSPLFADAGDWVGIVIFLIIVLSSLASQAYKALVQQQKQAQGRRPAPGRGIPPMGRDAREMGRGPQDMRRAAPQAQGGLEQAEQNRLESEIEAFLRRTMAGDKEKAAEPVKVEVVTPQSVTRVKPARSLADKEPIDSFPNSESVAEHVQRHVGSGGLSQRDARLGERVGAADERIENRLHQVFDHKLGRLQDTTSRPDDEYIDEGTDAEVWQEKQIQEHAAVTVGEITDMLKNPTDIRKAVILNEILKRPDDPWA